MIWRTAYKDMGDATNRTCPSCKSQNNPPLTSNTDLIEYRSFYKDKKFEAYQCPCGATWSAMIDRKTNA